MNIGLHHLNETYIKKETEIVISSQRFRKFVNKFIYVIGIFSIIVLVPQLISIWLLKNADGVSLFTWIGFIVTSSFWLFYGIIHKEKPIILTNAGALVIDILVVISVIFFKSGPIF